MVHDHNLGLELISMYVSLPACSNLIMIENVWLSDQSRSNPGQPNRLGPCADTRWHKAAASEHHQDVNGRLCTLYVSEYIYIYIYIYIYARQSRRLSRSLELLGTMDPVRIVYHLSGESGNVIVPTSLRYKCKWKRSHQRYSASSGD